MLGCVFFLPGKFFCSVKVKLQSVRRAISIGCVAAHIRNLSGEGKYVSIYLYIYIYIYISISTSQIYIYILYFIYLLFIFYIYFCDVDPSYSLLKFTHFI